MKRLLTLAIISIISFAVLAVSNPYGIQAQEQSDEKITLSPAIEKVSFPAGSAKAGKMTVINDGKKPYDFNVYAAPFSVKGEDYEPNFVEVNDRTQAYQWIEFAQKTYHLEPGERVVVDYVINVPANAAGGGHYAVLFAETQPSGNGENVVRKKRVGTLLYMAIDGTTQESGSIASLETNFWQPKPPITTDLRIKNDGNVHFQADIEFYYQNIFGKKQFQLKKESLVLPGTTRRIPISWENTPYFGIFRTGGTVKFFETTEQIPQQYVILLPYPIIIGAGVLIVLAVTVSVFKKRSKRKGSKLEDTTDKEK